MKFDDIISSLWVVAFIACMMFIGKSCIYDTICHDTITNSRERGTFVCTFPGNVVIKEMDNKIYYICSCPK